VPAQGELDNAMRDAMSAEERGELDEALSKYREIARKGAEADRLLAIRSYIHQASLEMKLGDARKALTTLDTAYTFTKPKTFNRDVVEALRSRAEKAIALEDEIKAKRAELLKTEREFITLSEIGNLQVKAGDMKGAAKTFDDVARLSKAPGEEKLRLRARLMKGRCLRELNQNTKAFEEVDSLVKDAHEAYPEVAQLAQQQRAKILQYLKRYAQAIDDYRSLAATPGMSSTCGAALRFQVGYIYLVDLADRAQATESFKELRTGPYREQPFGRLAEFVMSESGS
jgi:tetratricopeptide (TPR) repeat protein